MKIIVIEDEPNSLMGMKKAIESMEVDLNLFISNHAEQAIEIIKEQWPDLIVTDIMLPGMTGLDLIEQFVVQHYKPKIIVVSGHNDFEYAKRCIQFGAVDYLLKPFLTEDFIEKVRKCRLLIEQEKEQHHHSKMGNLLMRDSYLADFCLKQTALEEHIYQRLKLWDLLWLSEQSYILIVVDSKGYPDGKPLRHQYTLETFAIGNVLNDVLSEYERTVFFKDSQNRWIILTGIDNVYELAQSIYYNIKNYQKFDVAIGISERMNYFEEIYSAYQNAMKVFRIQTLSDNSDLNCDFSSSESNGYMSAEQMASLLFKQDEEAMARAVQHFVRDTVMLAETKGREDVIRNVLNYISQIHVSLSEITKKELEEIPMSIWEAVDDCKTIEEYQKLLTTYFRKLSSDLFAPKTNAYVERAIEKIRGSYMEGITLNEVANDLLIHPVWLSQVFKKETGKTFTEYLLDLRINRAKVLLRETSMKIYEIALEVGYQDLQHFGSLFKKKTGETPKEFRYGK